MGRFNETPDGKPLPMVIEPRHGGRLAKPDDTESAPRLSRATAGDRPVRRDSSDNGLVSERFGLREDLLSPGGAREPAEDPGPESDAELIRAILQRDRKATADFVSLHSDAIYAYVRWRLLPRTDLVDDLVQDVFVAALRSLASFAVSSSLRTWLLGIARHKVEDYYRANDSPEDGGVIGD